MKKRSKIGSKRTTMVQRLIAVIFFAYMICLILPYVYALFASVSDYKEYYFNIFPLPKDGLKLSNYLEAWTSLKHEGTGIPEMIINSLWFSGVFAVGGVFLCSCGAYICSKYRFFGRNFIYWFSLVTMMIPIIGNQSGYLKYIDALGGYNSYLYVVVTANTMGAGLIIMYSCFQSIDWAYAEAAFIDGASHAKVFFKIMLPHAMPTMTALMLSDFIAAWAGVENSLMYYPDLPTLSTGLYYFRTYVITAAGMQRYPAYFAAMLLCMLPTIVLFALFQEKLMNIQVSGGIKG